MKKVWKFVKHHILSCIVIGLCVYVMFYSLPFGLVMLVVPGGIMMIEWVIAYVIRSANTLIDHLKN